MSEELIQIPKEIADALEAGRAADAVTAEAERLARNEQARKTRDEIAGGMVGAGIVATTIDAQRAMNPAQSTGMVDAAGPNVINSRR